MELLYRIRKTKDGSKCVETETGEEDSETEAVSEAEEIKDHKIPVLMNQHFSGSAITPLEKQLTEYLESQGYYLTQGDEKKQRFF